jgi:hypothetical protein
VFHGNIIWQAVEASCGYGNYLRKPTVQVNSQEFERAAGIKVTGQAGCACMAGKNWIHGYFISDSITLVKSFFTNFGYRSTEFMPLDSRELHPAVEFTAVDVKIGPADSSISALNQHFIRANAWIWRLTQANFPVCV